MILPIFILASNLSTATPDVAKDMVPRGKIIETILLDYVVKTAAGTKITVEFTSAGEFKEAGGKNLNQGDELEPGEGLLSLSTVAQRLSKSGMTPKGFWALEREPGLGWVYQFNQAIVDAKTGHILKYLKETDSRP
jgi:hypothetical protein